jgi:hypothetical protein
VSRRVIAVLLRLVEGMFWGPLPLLLCTFEKCGETQSGYFNESDVLCFFWHVHCVQSRYVMALESLMISKKMKGGHGFSMGVTLFNGREIGAYSHHWGAFPETIKAAFSRGKSHETLDYRLHFLERDFSVL